MCIALRCSLGRPENARSCTRPNRHPQADQRMLTPGGGLHVVGINFSCFNPFSIFYICTHLIEWFEPLSLAEVSCVVSCPDPTHSNEETGLVLFEQFLGLRILGSQSELFHVTWRNEYDKKWQQFMLQAGFCSSYFLQRKLKSGSRARAGSAYIVGGWRTVSLK